MSGLRKIWHGRRGDLAAVAAARSTFRHARRPRPVPLADVSPAQPEAIRAPGTSERLPEAGNVEVEFPGAPAFKMEMVTKRHQSSAHELAALHVANNDWFALRIMSLWLFHTPPGATSLPPRVPVIASTNSV